MKDKLTTAFLIAPVLVLMLVLCFGSLLADAQQSTVPRVGFLAGGSPPAFQHLIEAFRQGMRERGYIDGQNFVIEVRAAESRFDRLPGLAADLVRSKVAVIVVGATGPLRAAKDATNTIPIVMASVGDPVGTGFIASLERPGGNITGVAGGAVPSAKLLELSSPRRISPSRPGELGRRIRGSRPEGLAADRHRGPHRGPTLRGGQAGGFRGGVRRYGEGSRRCPRRRPRCSDVFFSDPHRDPRG